MYLTEHIVETLRLPLFNVGVITFYLLVSVGLLQAVKFELKALALCSLLSIGLFVTAVTSLPSELIGNGGGVAQEIEAAHLFLISIGGLLSCIVGGLIKLITSCCSRTR